MSLPSFFSFSYCSLRTPLCSLTECSEEETFTIHTKEIRRLFSLRWVRNNTTYLQTHDFAGGGKNFTNFVILKLDLPFFFFFFFKYIAALLQRSHAGLEGLNTLACVFYPVECGKVANSFAPKFSDRRYSCLAVFAFLPFGWRDRPKRILPVVLVVYSKIFILFCR